ncbi:MAG: hypothetical protein BWY65_00267 [Firmicutes bacterium ADurb.Bin373]|nr:MAG: hypothetical protein BWY65_00267 [Firmicutes bacterium ADurb.Bin373]
MTGVLRKAGQTQGFCHPFLHFLSRQTQVFSAERRILLNEGTDDLVVRVLKNHAHPAADLPDIFRNHGVHPGDNDTTA